MDFFPITDFESSALKRKKRGRPEASDVDRMAAKAWYQYLAHQTGAMTPNRLGELFDVEDTNLFRKYRQGRSVPAKYVKMAERLVPGSRDMLERGPQGLFAVMRGDADECWWRATEYDDDGREIIGRDAPLDAAIARLVLRVAREIESGKRHDFRDLVRLVALFRIQCEAAKILSFEQEGLYELIWTMWRASPAIATVLRMLTIGKEFRNWMADMQYQRLALDKGWRLAFSEQWDENNDDPLIAYLFSPFEFLMAAPELHPRHPYLVAMPDTISSFLTRSCARK